MIRFVVYRYPTKTNKQSQSRIISLINYAASDIQMNKMKHSTKINQQYIRKDSYLKR